MQVLARIKELREVKGINFVCYMVRMNNEVPKSLPTIHLQFLTVREFKNIDFSFPIFVVQEGMLKGDCNGVE